MLVGTLIVLEQNMSIILQYEYSSPEFRFTTRNRVYTILIMLISLFIVVFLFSFSMPMTSKFLAKTHICNEMS